MKRKKIKNKKYREKDLRWFSKRYGTIDTNLFRGENRYREIVEFVQHELPFLLTDGIIHPIKNISYNDEEVGLIKNVFYKKCLYEG